MGLWAPGVLQLKDWISVQDHPGPVYTNSCSFTLLCISGLVMNFGNKCIVSHSIHYTFMYFCMYLFTHVFICIVLCGYANQVGSPSSFWSHIGYSCDWLNSSTFLDWHCSINLKKHQLNTNSSLLKHRSNYLDYYALTFCPYLWLQKSWLKVGLNQVLLWKKIWVVLFYNICLLEKYTAKVNGATP